MPLYEYRCTACGHVFEKIQSFSAPDEKSCPKCGSPVERLISAPAIQFKGSGFYLTDYGKSGGGSKSEGGSAKSEAGSTAGNSESKSSGGSSDSSAGANTSSVGGASSGASAGSGGTSPASSAGSSSSSPAKP